MWRIRPLLNIRPRLATDSKRCTSNDLAGACLAVNNRVSFLPSSFGVYAISQPIMFENEYRKRINIVVEHIDANLGQALTLDDLADVSGISKFHLHRLFHSFVGEPLAAFIRRQRLARGYRLNSDSKLGRGEVNGLGYRSMSSFIRAFRSLFGATPGTLAGYHGPTLTSQLSQTAEPRQIVLMPDRLEAIQPALVFGSLQRGYYNRGFEQTARRAFSTALKTAAQLKISSSLGIGIGLVFDDPDFTDPNRMEFFGGFELSHPSASIDPKPCELRPLQPGPVAIFVHRGSYRFLWQTWNAAYRNWLPQSGYQLRDAPATERYLVDPRNAKSEQDLITEVVIPIESTSPSAHPL
jgi:AraC family transcriptional regulator